MCSSKKRGDCPETLPITAGRLEARLGEALEEVDRQIVELRAAKG